MQQNVYSEAEGNKETTKGLVGGREGGREKRPSANKLPDVKNSFLAKKISKENFV